MSQFSTKTQIDIGGRELSIDVDFNFTEGTPASWDDPGEGANVEITGITAIIPVTRYGKQTGEQRHPLPDWLVTFLAEDDFLIEELAEDARGGLCSARDEAAEMRFEDMRMMAAE